MYAPKRGFTLVEILVSCTLVILVLTVALNLIIPALHAQLKTAAEVDLQEQCLVAMNRMVGDLAQSVPSAITLKPGTATTPMFLGVHRLVDVNDSDPPVQIWSRQMNSYYWSQGTRELKRQVYPADPDHPPGGFGFGVPTTLKAFRLDDTGAIKLAAYPPGPVTNLTVDVKEFKVTSTATAPNVGLPITLSLTLEKPGPGGKLLSFTLERTVTLRNAE